MRTITAVSFSGTLWDQTSGNNQDFVVIGYRRNATTHTWHWENGAPTTFTLWHSGNPQTIEASNSLCGGRSDCDCAIMVTAYPGIGDWQNVACDEQMGSRDLRTRVLRLAAECRKNGLIRVLIHGQRTKSTVKSTNPLSTFRGIGQAMQKV